MADTELERLVRALRIGSYARHIFLCTHGDCAPAAEAQAAWDFLNWLNGPDSGPNGASAMGDILMSMGILPSRTSDGAAFADRLSSDPFLAGYTATLANAKGFPVVLGGQEFSESLQKTLEAMQFGQLSAADAQATAQSDATEILTRAAQ